MASSFETTLFPIVQTINEYLSNYVLVFLLLGVGIWYTIKTHCVQVRCFKEGWNRVFGNITLNGKKGGGGMSSFQALATAIAAQVGVDEVVAEVLPEGKVEAVEQEKQKGLTVAMAGDGINDAPALAAADVGFAMGQRHRTSLWIGGTSCW